jgi:hypothetical protein
MLIKLPLVLIKSCYFKGHRNNVSAMVHISRSRAILREGKIASFLEFSYTFLFVQRERALEPGQDSCLP